MSQIVAFLDILGTSSRVRAGEFDDMEMLDFVGALCVLAHYVPSLRCAAFSDSVVVSADEDNVESVLIGLCFLFSSWVSDCVLVRGGLAVGDVTWIDQEKVDSHFRNLKNLAFTRVYGRGLLNAQDIERSSGPGAVCFISPTTSGLIKAFNADLVLRGAVDVLAWPSRRTNQWVQHLCSGLISAQDLDADISRQMAATVWYYREMERLSLFTPPDMIPFSPEIDERPKSGGS